ncbi:hypothetical protein [Halogeometricum sp. CBA1124]|uniref:hypothetical protein n=1 Tax=Halogeometricum sp. CBA1124 TaxID=2668071 RepID=UPI001429759B|nr:hypothetical protein [Halogeometricum sp. CBA1124]MUV58650.1 hypothetical protein [Halogeometricum sp. CBA1124]
MTRFDADDPKARRKLFAEAVTAHRTRASPFLTVEVEHDPDVDGEDAPAPWVQFADQTFNMDLTEAELERAKTLLTDFPEFRIDQMESPEEAEGTNLRIIARSDANRLAAFVDRVFVEVYGRDDDYRAWVAAV